MDLQTLIIAMGVPSAVTGLCFFWIEQKIKKNQAKLEEKEKMREKNEILIIKSTMASIALGEATATALKNGHCNGETEAALEYARKVKHEQKDFLIEQGIKALD
ncbi:serine/threonine protein kinase [Lactonifactor longoviformis]|uniref:serine/threonine protein kinase n=1 Tax=Clostridia TaxID=186801 RepID=UPI0036F25BB9